MNALRCASLSVLIMVALVDKSDASEEKASAGSTYEKMLYDLGAFPVARLTIKSEGNLRPGEAWSKGERDDVDGWLPPNAVPLHLTEAEKVRYGIPKKPLAYEQYVSMLDIDTYKRTREPKLFLVMRFSLESMLMNRVPVRKADILRVYEAKIGLEKWAILLLHEQLSSTEAMRLVRAYDDERLFSILPPPQPDDRTYVAFLEELSHGDRWPIHCRNGAHKLLFTMDERTYRDSYQGFLLNHVKTAKDWWDRAELYASLIRLKNAHSLRIVSEGLTHDPITECREAILYHLQEQGEAASVMDAVLAVAQRRDEKHHHVVPNRMVGQWSYRLNEYLKWAKSQQGLDAGTRKKVDEAIKRLQDKEWD